jgi:carbon starvation protein
VAAVALLIACIALGLAFPVFIQMFIMLAVTFTALVFSIRNNFGNVTAYFGGAEGVNITGSSLQLVFGVLLLALGIMVAVQGIQKLGEKS